MTEIVLATLNARYIHCSFGLRYLLANMGELQNSTTLLEFTIQQPTLEILDTILRHQPRIVGLSIYIWNLDETTRLVADLKRVSPSTLVVLGGPEVSYEAENLEIVRLADQVISGEGDLAFAEYCRRKLPACVPKLQIANSNKLTLNVSPAQGGLKKLLPDYATDSQQESGLPVEGPTGLRESRLPLAGDSKFIMAPLPNLAELVLPYDFYTDEDISHRVIYVEASRGCPFECEFCLSALDIPVRQFPLEKFLAAMESLLKRGARQFKFVDRTFNLNLRVGRSILEFFLERYEPGIFLHFEMIPDRLPEALKDLIVRFPDGALQFEVGIQTFNPDVCERISRRQDNDVAEQNLRWLCKNTGVHIHADLIVGLPGESIESFAEGFDRLVEIGPHEIQVGILKRLRGTPIIRHDAEWQMVYSPHPPYEILSNRSLEFSKVQELRRFAKYWDLFANSGNFVETLPLIWYQDGQRDFVDDNALIRKSPFTEFCRFVEWIFEREAKTHGIPLSRSLELLFEFLIQEHERPSAEAAATLWRDYQRGGRNDKPACLRPYIEEAESRLPQAVASEFQGPRRQARHRK